MFTPLTLMRNLVARITPEEASVLLGRMGVAFKVGSQTVQWDGSDFRDLGTGDKVLFGARQLIGYTVLRDEDESGVEEEKIPATILNPSRLPEGAQMPYPKAAPAPAPAPAAISQESLDDDIDPVTGELPKPPGLTEGVDLIIEDDPVVILEESGKDGITEL